MLVEMGVQHHKGGEGGQAQTRWTSVLLSWLLIMLAVAGLAAPAAASSRMSALSVTTDGDRTRIIVEVDGGFASPRLFAMAGPDRLVIDFPGVTLGPRTASGGGAIAGLRTGTPGITIGRVVADIASPVAFVDTRTFDPATPGAPHRLIVELRTGTPADFQALVRRGGFSVPGTLAAPAPPAANTIPPRIAAALPPAPVAGPSSPAAPSPAAPVPATQPPAAAPAAVALPPAVPAATPAQTQPAAAPAGPVPRPIAVPELRPRTVPIRGRLPVIVIDPGHGGQDPGAPSVIQGRFEKQVTLPISLAIKEELERTGRFRVVLTRTTDIFIPLAERVNIARDAKADLFISIHADSIADPAIRGATVYTLSETASDREAERLAAKENKADIIAGINLGGESPDVTDILIDLAQRETMNFSAEFARVAVREMSRFTLFRSNFHRFAGFRVLKAPDVPSILLETGYMSNLEDSRFLFSEDGQRSVARGVRRAVEVYFDRRTAQASEPAKQTP
jgi:N-acetylmuramoyl-L-alanine amidase